ncbi:hypothetical protein GWK91_00680 [Virgibacillus sp. MSP4-1]|uniref:YhdB family protein n=1 Tax=Salinibacillus aidingensis TaxID=237684 RepID=A0ABN1B4Y4_9BACI|nr:YhdB family protein [Virgibacillus sp. MSP4-1]QHS21561.1 hypothetical protein GWK91_00680 [Virgibacillus sp. MSP4-1]
MNMVDYDKAMYFTLWGQWDDLLVLMVRTDDDFLSKKIETFLHAYHYGYDETTIVGSHQNLIHYLEHAITQDTPVYYV